MLWVPVPTAFGVYETLHLAAFVPLAARLGHGLGVNVPDPLVENITVPVGTVAPVAAVSVTVAMHEDAVPTPTGDEQDTTVVVGSLTPGAVTVAP
jgi:hypothetical protein